jgi:glucose/arabinose dehydrogenase
MGTVSERDRLGGGLPPDYLTRIGKGDFFGWPFAYIGLHPDPACGKEHLDLVARTKLPEVLFEPHSAPLGLVFYDGAEFPAEYRPLPRNPDDAA